MSAENHASREIIDKVLLGLLSLLELFFVELEIKNKNFNEDKCEILISELFSHCLFFTENIETVILS